MTIKDLRLNPAQDAYETLDAWSNRMGIPVRSLLAHAAMGEFPVFIATNLSAHTLRYVDTRRLDLKKNEVDYPPPLSEQRILKKPYYSGRLIGLCLDSTHCESLAKGQELRLPFFTTAMFLGISGITLVDCKEDAWENKLPKGTCFAMFPTQTPHFFSGSRGWRQSPSRFLPDAVSRRTPEEFLRAPISFHIQSGAACVRDVDIAHFICRLTSYGFIDDLFDGKSVAAHLPEYISAGLKILVESHRKFWNEREKLTDEEKASCRKQLENSVLREFDRVCKKKRNATALAVFGANICDPFSKDEVRLTEATLVPPRLLALLTAAKLFWLPHYSQASKYKTRPPSPALVANFLQFMALNQANDGWNGSRLLNPKNWEAETKTEATQLKLDWPITSGPLRPIL